MLLDTRKHVIQPSGFRSMVVLDCAHLELAGNQVRLCVGMLVSVDLHLSKRTVTDCVLCPVQKTVYEARAAGVASLF
ncbi:MAG: hypothetical protein ACREUQ_01515 [Burkholderiales bacterium]